MDSPPPTTPSPPPRFPRIHPTSRWTRAARGARSRSERSRLDRTVAGSIRASDGSLFDAFPASDGSLFGALARSRIPPERRANEDALDVRLTVPPRGEGGFLDPAWLADRRAGDIFTPECEDSNDSNPTPNPSETRDVRRDEEASPSDAKGDAEAWLAAATSSSSSNALTLGWDLGDMRPACGAFMTRGSRAFGRAYDAHLRPAARLFSGGAGPATATEEELVAAASRALAGERAATSAIRTDAFGNRERPSLRLPAASAGAVAATLAPLATAAERRAALDAFARDSSGFGIGRGFRGSGGFGFGESSSLRVCESASLATQAAAATTRAILRAHDAALRALPSAVARRRAAERAAGAAASRAAYARLDAATRRVGDVRRAERHDVEPERRRRRRRERLHFGLLWWRDASRGSRAHAASSRATRDAIVSRARIRTDPNRLRTASFF